MNLAQLQFCLYFAVQSCYTIIFYSARVSLTAIFVFVVLLRIAAISFYNIPTPLAPTHSTKRQREQTAGLRITIFCIRIQVGEVILQILERWFDISINCVKCGNHVSIFIALKAGVLQGGTISPCLFAIFIDEIATKFKRLSRFCNSKYVCTNFI